MNRLFWVRHGPTHAKGLVGWTDLPADLRDGAQLARLSAHLPAEALVLSSDLCRAVETATAICGARRRLAHERDLREIHFGAWEMQVWDTIPDQTHLRAFWDQPGEIHPPGGESWNALRARADRAVDHLITGHPGRDLIIVAHFGVILTQVQRALRIGAHEAFAHKIDPFSVTELHLGAAGWHAEAINHLP